MVERDSGSADWARELLYRLGDWQSQNSITSLHLWALSEGMPASYNNWLATTKAGFGGTSINGVGVKHYPDFMSGIRATVATLNQNNFTTIREAFRADAGPLVIWTAINHSPWCGAGCQDGKYPIRLYEALTTPPPTPATTQQTPVPAAIDPTGLMRGGYNKFAAAYKPTDDAIRALSRVFN